MKSCLVATFALIAAAAVTANVQAATIVSTTPSDDSTGVAVDTDLTIAFSEFGILNITTVQIFKSSDNTPYGTAGNTGDVLGETFVYELQNGNLESGTSYYVHVPDAAFFGVFTNTASSAVSDSTTWNFTTVPEPSSLALLSLGGFLIMRRSRR